MKAVDARVRLVDGPEICSASNVMVSAFKVVASDLDFLGDVGIDIRNALRRGEKLPVSVYLDGGTEMVVGEAFIHEQTPDRLHVGIFRHYCLDEATGRWRA